MLCNMHNHADISPPGSFATNQLATKRPSRHQPSRHQAKSTRHQTQIKMMSTVCRGELAAQTNFFFNLSVQKLRCEHVIGEVI